MFSYANYNYWLCIVLIYFSTNNGSKFYRNTGLGETFSEHPFYLGKYKSVPLVLLKDAQDEAGGEKQYTFPSEKKNNKREKLN